MSYGETFLLSVLKFFTPQMHMALTKIAGVVCSFADIAFIVILLKTAHSLKPGTPPPRKRLALLYVFAALTPTLLFPISNDAFTIWQSFVVGAPYLLLAHTVVTEFQPLLAHVKEKIHNN